MTSQLERLCDKLGVTVETLDCIAVPDHWPQGTWGINVRLRYKRRQLTTPFYLGPAHTSEPSAGDVLSCLISDANTAECSDTFEGFCDDFGLDHDSRKAEHTWKLVQRLAPKVRRFLGDDWDTFVDAEH